MTTVEHVIAITSGEGELGSSELYDGDQSDSAIQARLEEERCGGDRWARAIIYSHDNDYGPVGVNFETGEYTNWPLATPTPPTPPVINLGCADVCHGGAQLTALEKLAAHGHDTDGCDVVTWHDARGQQPPDAIAVFRVRPRDPRCWVVRKS